jgi:AcrR family transcriptional regulator
MPKIYSQKERDDIKFRLKQEANACLLKYGVKKTTVDELVERVGIPKGTFYLFYKSKEILLFEVIQDYHETIENLMLAKMAGLKENINADTLSVIILDAIKYAMNSCLKTLMVPGEMELLISKLPDEIVAEHLQHDDGLMNQFFQGLQLPPDIDMEAIGGAFRGIVFACLYRREIGDKNFDESIRLMVKGLLLQILNK